MRQSWRWFGPSDPVSLDHIRQAGATDIVSALHHIPTGEVWPYDEVIAYKEMIEGHNDSQTPLIWSVVESVPVHDDIKRGAQGCDHIIDNFIQTMENLAIAGIKTICYNFMPVIDWTRTDLSFELDNGARALRFDQDEFAAFDLYILKREAATTDYSQDEKARAQKTFDTMSQDKRDTLVQNIIAGLPGKMTDAYTLDDFREALKSYDDIDQDALRANLFHFLKKILPHAERLGIQMAIHPDDPPRDMLGLPRIICTPEDLTRLFNTLPSPANGLTLCVGTFGSHPTNDLVAMARDFGERIYFAHLRGVKKDPADPRTFYEAEHLDSDMDMIGIIQNLLAQEQYRHNTQDGNPDYLTDIPVRPDHGHQMLDDLHKQGNPGYSGIGRLKGLAEIRGVIKTLQTFAS